MDIWIMDIIGHGQAVKKNEIEFTGSQKAVPNLIYRVILELEYQWMSIDVHGRHGHRQTF